MTMVKLQIWMQEQGLEVDHIVRTGNIWKFRKAVPRESAVLEPEEIQAWAARVGQFLDSKNVPYKLKDANLSRQHAAAGHQMGTFFMQAVIEISSRDVPYAWH